MKENGNLTGLIVKMYQNELVSIIDQVTDIQKTIFEEGVFDDHSISLLDDITSQCNTKRNDLRMMKSLNNITTLNVPSTSDSVNDELTKLIDKCEVIMFKINRMKSIVKRLIIDKDTYGLRCD